MDMHSVILCLHLTVWNIHTAFILLYSESKTRVVLDHTQFLKIIMSCNPTVFKWRYMSQSILTLHTSDSKNAQTVDLDLLSNQRESVGSKFNRYRSTCLCYTCRLKYPLPLHETFNWLWYFHGYSIPFPQPLCVAWLQCWSLHIYAKCSVSTSDCLLWNCFITAQLEEEKWRVVKEKSLHPEIRMDGAAVYRMKY